MRKICTQTYEKSIQPTQSRTHTKSVQPTQSHILCAKPYTNVRKSRTTYAKPHTIVQPLWYIHLTTNKQVYLKRHVMQKTRKVSTGWSWLDKSKIGKFTNKYQRLNSKGTAFVIRKWWHAQTASAHRSTQWGFNSSQAKIHIFDHKKKLIEVLRASLAIAQGFPGENITTGPNQYRFTQHFLDGELLRIFNLKLTELCHKTVANLILVIDHVVTYFGPK